jgi:hypothetical protein
MLENITIGKNHRGQCQLCNKKSFRWQEWKHVQQWYDNHKCINGLKTSRNGKTQAAQRNHQ